MEGAALDWVTAEKVLGTEHQYVEGVRRAQQEQRGLKAIDAAARLAPVPTGWEHKDKLAAVAVLPIYVFGSENHGVTKQSVHDVCKHLELSLIHI